MIIPNWDPSNQEQRRKTIGGSDAASCIPGANPHKGTYRLYAEKRGDIEPDPENEKMEWGHLIEPILIQEFNKRVVKGRGRARRDGRTHQHPDYPWMIAHPDGFWFQRRPAGTLIKWLIECKNVSAENRKYFGKAGSDVMPIRIWLQVQHNLAVTGYDRAAVPVLFGGNEMVIFYVGRDELVIKKLIVFERWLMWHVETGNPPPITRDEEIRGLWGRGHGGVVEATPGMVKTWENYQKRLSHKKRIEGLVEDSKFALQTFLQGAHYLNSNQGVLVTYKDDSQGKRSCRIKTPKQLKSLSYHQKAASGKSKGKHAKS